MKIYNKIEMISEISTIDMGGYLMALEIGDVLVVANNNTNRHFLLRENEIGETDVKVTSAMASSMCINNIARAYKEDRS